MAQGITTYILNDFTKWCRCLRRLGVNITTDQQLEPIDNHYNLRPTHNTRYFIFWQDTD